MLGWACQEYFYTIFIRKFLMYLWLCNIVHVYSLYNFLSHVYINTNILLNIEHAWNYKNRRAQQRNMVINSLVIYIKNLSCHEFLLPSPHLHLPRLARPRIIDHRIVPIAPEGLNLLGAARVGPVAPATTARGRWRRIILSLGLSGTAAAPAPE